MLIVSGLWLEINNLNQTDAHSLFPSEATTANLKTIMKRNFKQSTIPSITTK